MSPRSGPDHDLVQWLRGYRSALGGATPPSPGTGTPARVFSGPPSMPPTGADLVTAAPARFPSAHEQAAHELALATALVLNAPQASHALGLLVNSNRIHPEGAVVFAGLLFLTGREEAAQFWWQFAAGSGNNTAAYCLHLYHLQLGETRDAAYWRGQAEQLAVRDPAARRRSVRSPVPLLPDDVRLDILARCHQGLCPRLPVALESVINRLVVDSDDDDFGEIPQPCRRLIDELATHQPN
ncbi:hypothetical protein ACFC1R_13120 [Kitasatospora sp. NPDC056138]|uniref:hypothetical protein n=1 Tax=Kitasatospora sp. NPDC056138 TaxID=3345724 RepID=UPI0035D78CC4